MSATYRAVQWNPQKRAYDRVIAASVTGYLAVFVGTGAVLFPDATLTILLIRAFGTAAFTLLQLILCIGPLCRLAPRFLPLLYNRRHLGVTAFALALAHAGLSVFEFHAFGDADLIASVLSGGPRFDPSSPLPFQAFGLAALVILFVLAATSHDFWLANLTPPVWKALHVSVYLAYALLVAHISFGVLQSDAGLLYPILLAIGLCILATLHLAAARREAAADHTPLPDADRDGFIEVCRIDQIEENRARIVSIDGERIAIFRHEGRFSAVSNTCPHQNGPLGEGRIIDGCITCPWHGHRFDPVSGTAQAPGLERILTFPVRVQDGIVRVCPRPSGAAGPNEHGTAHEG